jgi:lipid II:glycine glycyltransferase (peptidoglycan interpeptide bridge formation enzyme)
MPTSMRGSRYLASPSAEGFVVIASDAPDDPEWDDFLETAPAGGYTQTSCWGRARAVAGWRLVRAVISRGGRVVAGVQMELRALPLGGNVAMVFGGPVVAGGEGALDATRAVLDAMRKLAKSNKVRYVAVRPPGADAGLVRALGSAGFRRGMLDDLHIYYPASVVLDLAPDAELLLAGMSKKRRQNIRATERAGVAVRKGTEEDLPVFERLRITHAARLGYEPREAGYYEELWRSLSPRGHIHLFVAEYGGDAVAAQLAISFGDTCHHVERPWSGAHPEIAATELVEWAAILWAKSAGMGSSDLGGVAPSVVEAIREGREDAADPEHGATHYKLRWGGRVVEGPPFLDHAYDPLLSFVYQHVPGWLKRSHATEKLAKRLRGA